MTLTSILKDLFYSHTYSLTTPLFSCTPPHHQRTTLHLCGLLMLHLIMALPILNLSESNSRHPPNTILRNTNLTIELINLLQRKALRLIDHEVDENDADETASAPDKEDLRLEIGVSWTPVDEIGSRVCDSPVEEPVRRSGHGEGLGADFEGEDLAGDDPSDWTPGRREEEDVDADECDGCLLGGVVVYDDVTSCVLTGGCCAEDSNDELRDAHADGSPEENWSSTPLLDGVEAREGGGCVDAVGDQADDEGVGEAGVLEELSSVLSGC